MKLIHWPPIGILGIFILFTLNATASADETQGSYTGKFLGLDKLKLSTADGPVTTFIIQLKNGKKEGVCLLGLSKEEKQIRKNPKGFIGRSCTVEWGTAETQLADGEVIDLIVLSSLKWLSDKPDKSTSQGKTNADNSNFPFSNMTMYFESPGAANAIFLDGSTTGSAPFLAESFRGYGIARGAYKYSAFRKGSAKWEIQLSGSGSGNFSVTVGPGISKSSGGAFKARGVLRQDGGTREVDLIFAPGNRLDSASPPAHLR
jgi:hypothetical protein